MRFHRQTGIAMIVALAVLLALNFWCWQPGIGGGSGGRPPGAELELFYGWPATYQAEWWRSEDQTLTQRLLQTAPLCRPGDEMERQARYFGAPAALADLAFALAVLFAIGAAVESLARRSVSIYRIAGLLVALLVMVLVLAVAERLDTHL
ncbi:hypothetical protein [Zavarzinella formosa]|uniref:hypothetical protein n=1 Tax=Zavarzinella formosa TaxID=360055 RepID=UPI00031722E1|nr:hypothetical protein [Zavarzinella formosa]